VPLDIFLARKQLIQRDVFWESLNLGYVHLVRGRLGINGHALHGGDAGLLANEDHLVLGSGDNAEVLVFDLAP